ncbi:MAG: hypothetical protein ACK5G7_06670 [Erysipelotrichaceae bacterium]
MSSEYIEVTSNENANGKIAMSMNVVEEIIIRALNEINNIELATSTTFNKAIESKVVYGDLKVTINIKVNKNYNVYDLSSEIQNKVNLALMQIANISCYSIDIKIVEFLF